MWQVTFVFSQKWNFIFVGIFTAENEKCIFGRPLRQTVSDYTLHRWFSNTQQSRFRTACRCLEKLVLPSIFDTSHPSSSSSLSRIPSELLCHSVGPGGLRYPQRIMRSESWKGIHRNQKWWVLRNGQLVCKIFERRIWARDGQDSSPNAFTLVFKALTILSVKS